MDEVLDTIFRNCCSLEAYSRNGKSSSEASFRTGVDSIAQVDRRWRRLAQPFQYQYLIVEPRSMEKFEAQPPTEPNSLIHDAHWKTNMDLARAVGAAGHFSGLMLHIDVPLSRSVFAYLERLRISKEVCSQIKSLRFVLDIGQQYKQLAASSGEDPLEMELHLKVLFPNLTSITSIANTGMGADMYFPMSQLANALSENLNSIQFYAHVTGIFRELPSPALKLKHLKVSSDYRLFGQIIPKVHVSSLVSLELTNVASVTIWSRFVCRDHTVPLVFLCLKRLVFGYRSSWYESFNIQLGVPILGQTLLTSNSFPVLEFLDYRSHSGDIVNMLDTLSSAPVQVVHLTVDCWVREHLDISRFKDVRELSIRFDSSAYSHYDRDLFVFLFQRVSQMPLLRKAKFEFNRHGQCSTKASIHEELFRYLNSPSLRVLSLNASVSPTGFNELLRGTPNLTDLRIGIEFLVSETIEKSSSGRFLFGQWVSPVSTSLQVLALISDWSNMPYSKQDVYLKSLAESLPNLLHLDKLPMASASISAEELDGYGENPTARVSGAFLQSRSRWRYYLGNPQ
ncbi:hypothetical protein DL89DRAFT_266115 [Linderina pennispora]|uniref:Uncharacterized protein n=1 Tax=Linderina pennispora TaxID=61395 RepID=A0A1Y1WCN0_9FUNG|nr:uncharacterized protein DL89DRAFT_266115 [Linderina pennispora]ORX71088.1 hypothetical protein DL89DRAFT_266115 [Linderina pennispora]